VQEHASALGAWPITLDPIFSGLAWALIFGLFASSAFTLVVVPLIHYMLNRPATRNFGDREQFYFRSLTSRAP
jgi:multidrug efflux pump subunit AcrB